MFAFSQITLFFVVSMTVNSVACFQNIHKFMFKTATFVNVFFFKEVRRGEGIFCGLIVLFIHSSTSFFASLSPPLGGYVLGCVHLSVC